MMPPHVAQFVLRKPGRKVRCGIAPRPALQREHVQARLAQFLAHDGPGPSEADQHRIYRFKSDRHDLLLRPTGPAFGADGGIGHTLAMTGHPLLVIVMSPRKSDHPPGSHVLIAAVDRIGEVTLLGVLQEHGEKGFAVDTVIEFNVAALEPLQHRVLIALRKFAEQVAIEGCTDVLLDRDNGSAIQLRGTEAALIALFRRPFRPRSAQKIVVTAPELPRQLPIQEKSHARLDAPGSDGIVGYESRNRRVDEGDFGRRAVNIRGTRRSGRRIRGSLLPRNRAAKGLRRRAELAVVHGCRNTAYS